MTDVYSSSDTSHVSQKPNNCTFKPKPVPLWLRKEKALAHTPPPPFAIQTLQLDKMSENIETSEARRKELQEYVGKLERKLGGRNVNVGLGRRGIASSHTSSDTRNKAGKESLYEALAELQNENAKLHSALQEVEEALDGEAKALSMADGGALLESLRTRRLLETAELALKKETAAKKQAETRLRQAEMRAIRAEDERTDRVKAEDALLVRVATCAVGVSRFSRLYPIFFQYTFLALVHRSIIVC